MERSLFKYVWRHSKRDQGAILVLVAVSMVFYFISLDLPKQIVNIGIQGQGFEGPGSTQTFFALDLPLIGQIFEGFDLEQMASLMALSFTFLGLVMIKGLFKFVINTAKGRLGERMLRRLRYELADRLLRFPLRHVRRMRTPEVATMIKDEVEPLGGFIGDAFVTPAFLGGQAITAMAFIITQSLWLGAIAAVIVLVQAIIIPYLRKRVLVLGRERQLTARALAGRIGEVMEGAAEVHTNDASHWERAELSRRLGRIFWIRYEIFRRKYFVKFLSNFMSEFTPFIFYSVGGYLAINGQLNIGALVAVIAAYKDLPGPVRDLINWEQQRADVQIKYEAVVEQFERIEVMGQDHQAATADTAPKLDGPISFTSAALADDDENRVVEGLTFELEAGEMIAVVGDGASGKEHLPYMLAALTPATSGHVTVGGKEVDELPEQVLGRRIGFVSQTAYLFALSVRENLLYGLKHYPLRDAEYPEESARELAERLAEAKRAANSTLDSDADWIDYEAAGVRSKEELTRHLTDCVRIVGLEEDIYRFGLFGKIDPEKRPEIADAVLKARQAVAKRIGTDGESDLVEHFHRDQFNNNATLAENLLYGTPVKDAYDAANLAKNDLIRSLLKKLDLEKPFAERGLKIAEFFTEIFADLPPGHPFFDQFSFISSDDLPVYEQLVQRADKVGIDELTDEEFAGLLGLPFNYIEARHRLDLVDEAFAEAVVAAREKVLEKIEAEDKGAVAFYNVEEYNAAASLLDNILFGRLVYGQAEAQETVESLVSEVLAELSLRDEVLEVGLDYDVGAKGQRLSATQRQKLAIARALVKRPDLLIMEEATAVMDGATRVRTLEAVLKTRRETIPGSVFCSLERASLAEQFDYVIVMKGGRVAEQGRYAELNQEGSALHELLTSD